MYRRNESLMAQQIQFVVSDVDGTLIYKGEPFNGTRFPVMLDTLARRGIPFAVATGRHFRELEGLFGRQNVRRIACVCCHGAYTVERGVLTDAKVISRHDAEALAAYAESSGLAVEIHTFETTYLIGGNFAFRSKERTRLRSVTEIRRTAEIPTGSAIFEVSLYAGVGHSFGHSMNPGASRAEPGLPMNAGTGCGPQHSGQSFSARAAFSPAAVPAFSAAPLPSSVVCPYTARGIAEYTAAGVSKLDAVRALARRQGAALPNLLFFGDGPNDAPLIGACGVSYTTYCADRAVFPLTKNHTRDVIGTIIRLFH